MDYQSAPFIVLSTMKDLRHQQPINLILPEHFFIAAALITNDLMRSDTPITHASVAAGTDALRRSHPRFFYEKDGPLKDVLTNAHRIDPPPPPPPTKNRRRRFPSKDRKKKI